MRQIATFLFFFAWSLPSSAQQRVDPRFTHHRVYCIFPLKGFEKTGELIQPDYEPIKDVLATYSEVSDDGKWALVEIVSLDRRSLEPLLSDRRPGVWVAEKGVVPRAEILEHFRALKKTIDLDRFGAVVR